VEAFTISRGKGSVHHLLQKRNGPGGFFLVGDVLKGGKSYFICGKGMERLTLFLMPRGKRERKGWVDSCSLSARRKEGTFYSRKSRRYRRDEKEVFEVHLEKRRIEFGGEGKEEFLTLELWG